MSDSAKVSMGVTLYQFEVPKKLRSVRMQQIECPTCSTLLEGATLLTSHPQPVLFGTKQILTFIVQNVVLRRRYLLLLK